MLLTLRLCALCRSQNNERFLSYTTLTDFFITVVARVYCAVRTEFLYTVGTVCPWKGYCTWRLPVIYWYLMRRTIVRKLMSFLKSMYFVGRIWTYIKCYKKSYCIPLSRKYIENLLINLGDIKCTPIYDCDIRCLLSIPPRYTKRALKRN